MDLQTLLDKEAIRTLVLKYSRAADRHDDVAMRQLYHEDATRQLSRDETLHKFQIS